MDSSLIFRLLLTASLVCVGSAASFAQQEPAQDEPAQEEPAQEEPAQEEPAQEEPAQEEPAQEEPAQEEPAQEEPAQEEPAQEEPAQEEPAQEEPAQEEPAQEEPAQEEPAQEEPAPKPVEAEPIEPPPAQAGEQDAQDSPISDLAEESQDEEFVPLEDIEEGVLETITPVEVYPYVDWSGHFRLRSEVNVNFDLDTGGTSAVSPPIDEFVSSNTDSTAPVEEEADTLWSTDMRLRLEPHINITEALSLHVEADLFDNIVLGTRYDDPDFYGVINSRDDRASFIRVNEGWGEVEAFFGTLRAGRMDDDWGLGIFADDGDCLDCDVENPIDRISFTSQVWRDLGLYARLTADFPSEGATTGPLLFDGQPYDVGQADDTDQFTLSLFRKPVNREDLQLRTHRLKVAKQPVFNGGIYFTYRNQSGFFSPDPTLAQGSGELDQLDKGLLVYRGMELYVPDLWVEMLYNPEPDMLVRVALEAVGIFGSIDNATREPVGVTADGQAVNCFNDSQRQNNETACTTQGVGEDRTTVSEDITEFGVALESELYFGGPLRFGLNGGYASGGSQTNWGFDVDDEGNVVAAGGAGLDFYRFNPNYHVDLILFREVIGTVTNAYYGNPWAQVRFLETPDSRMELQFDAIVSAAANTEGTPSAIIEDGEAAGGNRWLGLELDAAARYIETSNFTAELEGGILFPFSGLGARTDGRRLVPVGDGRQAFGSDVDPSLAWTVQGNLYWTF